MSNERLKPVYVMWQEGVKDDHIVAAKQGILRVFKTAGVSEPPDALVKPVGAWRQETLHRRDGVFVAGTSVFAWIESARSASAVPGSLNADKLLAFLQANPWSQKEYPHYPFLVIREAMYWNRKDKSGTVHHDDVAGITLPGIGAIVTTAGYSKTEDHRTTMVHFVSMHEIGHVFLLIPNKRIEGIEKTDEHGTHCANPCVMRLRIMEMLAIEAQLRAKPLCDLCAIGLAAYFFPPPVQPAPTAP